MPPTELDLDRLEELAARATPGKWKVNDRSIFGMSESDPRWEIDQESGSEPFWLALALSLDNANLIVALHNALPAILAKLREGERAEELNAASHDMMMKANARLIADRDALARALAAIVDTNPANPYSWRTWLGEHTEALKIARRVAG